MSISVVRLQRVKYLQESVFHVTFTITRGRAAIECRCVVLHNRRSALSSAAACTVPHRKSGKISLTFQVFAFKYTTKINLCSVWLLTVIPNGALADSEAFVLLG